MTNTEVLGHDLTPVLQRSFRALLLTNINDESGFAQLHDLLKRQGLTTFRQPSPFKAREIEFDKSQIEDGRYRRRLIKQLAAPRPGNWVYVHLEIERAQLVENSYLETISRLLALVLSEKIGSFESEVDWLITSKLMSPETLQRLLHELRPCDFDASTVAASTLRQEVEHSLDANPDFVRCIEQIKTVGQAAREDFLASMATVRSDVQARFYSASEAIVAKAGASCDSFIAELRRQQAEREEEERANQVVSSNLSPEQEFRAAILKREADYREANKLSTRAKAMWSIVAVAGTAVLSHFLEINGATVVEHLTEFVDYLKSSTLFNQEEEELQAAA
jgi:hypothetical protein